MNLRAVLLILALLAPLHSYAQQTGAAPNPSAFEVASVKLNKTCGNGIGLPSITPGGVRLPCFSVRQLIGLAHGVFSGSMPNSRRIPVLGGPAWIDSERYDIAARTETRAADAADLAPMLQALLKERFQLAVHTEPRERDVFDLTVSGKGPKLQIAREEDCVPVDLFTSLALLSPGESSVERQCGKLYGPMKNGKMSLYSYGITIPQLAGWLSSLVPGGRDIVDRTGLAGRFNIQLEFVPERPRQAHLNGQPVELPAQDELAGPSIVVALATQLGLKLKPAKARLNAIIVDKVERPSGN